ncbi:MAG: PPC domain-containing protein, partial [Microcoleaceae cyanobacterium]
MNFDSTETFNTQTEILPYFNQENLETINTIISSAENITETDLQQLTLTNTEDLLLDPQNLTTLISDWQENQSQQPSDEKQTDPLTGQQFGQIQRRSDAPANIIYPFPEPGDTLLTAYNIDSLNDSQTYSDFVDGYYDDLTDDYFDGNDYYRFALDQTSNMEVVLDNLQDDANLELLNSNGQLLKRSVTPGSADEFISQTQLTAGDYYLRVYPDFEAFTPYDLTFNFETTKSEDLAGNTRRQAYNIGQLNGGEIFNDFVGDSDKHDYYQFEIQENSQLDISLDELEANANIRLRNSGGRVIETSTRGGDNSELISSELDSGEYYLEVYRGGRGENTEYELSFDVSEINSDLAGNTRGQAYNIGQLNGGEIFNDFVGDSDTKDFYKFRLNETSDVELVL